MRIRFVLVTHILLAVVAVCLASGQASGTEALTQDREQITGDQWMHVHGAQNQLNWFTDRLNLTDAQQLQLQPILENGEKQMKAIHDNGSLTQYQRRDQMRQIHQSIESQIRIVLTPEQQQEFTQLQQSHAQAGR